MDEVGGRAGAADLNARDIVVEHGAAAEQRGATDKGSKISMLFKTGDVLVEFDSRRQRAEVESLKATVWRRILQVLVRETSA